MRIFQQRTRIQKFDGVKAFVKEYQIGENDFILASKSVYEKFFMPLELKAHVEYKGKYGAGEPAAASESELCEIRSGSDGKNIPGAVLEYIGRQTNDNK